MLFKESRQPRGGKVGIPIECSVCWFYQQRTDFGNRFRIQNDKVLLHCALLKHPPTNDILQVNIFGCLDSKKSKQSLIVVFEMYQSNLGAGLRSTAATDFAPKAISGKANRHYTQQNQCSIHYRSLEYQGLHITQKHLPILENIE